MISLRKSPKIVFLGSKFSPGGILGPLDPKNTFNRLPAYLKPWARKIFGAISHRRKFGFAANSKWPPPVGAMVDFLIWTLNRPRS